MCRSSPAIKPRGKSHSVGDVFLGEIDDQGNYWTADITVNGHPTRFKLDTGAGVSVLSDQTPWLNNCQLDRQPIKLRGPGGIPRPVIGALKVTMRYQNREIVDTVYVLRNQPTSLLSKAACVSLKIISRVDEISGSSVKDRDVERQTQHTDDVRLFIGIIDTYTWCNNQ